MEISVCKMIKIKYPVGEDEKNLPNFEHHVESHEDDDDLVKIELLKHFFNHLSKNNGEDIPSTVEKATQTSTPTAPKKDAATQAKGRRVNAESPVFLVSLNTSPQLKPEVHKRKLDFSKENRFGKAKKNPCSRL